MLFRFTDLSLVESLRSRDALSVRFSEALLDPNETPDNLFSSEGEVEESSCFIVVVDVPSISRKAVTSDLSGEFSPEFASLKSTDEDDEEVLYESTESCLIWCALGSALWSNVVLVVWISGEWLSLLERGAALPTAPGVTSCVSLWSSMASVLLRISLLKLSSRPPLQIDETYLSQNTRPSRSAINT